MNCAEVRDLAPELALGILGGAERAELILHTNACVRCQSYVLEFSEVVDALPLLAPEAEPSPGFEQRVLADIGAPARRNRRRFVAAIAAVAAAAAILSITVVRVVESGDTATRPPVAFANPLVAPMIGGASNQVAGFVSVAYQHAVTITVNYNVPGGTYAIRLASAEGHFDSIGSVAVDPAGHGFWAGSSPSPITEGSTISLVDSAGAEACHGLLVARS